MALEYFLIFSEKTETDFDGLSDWFSDGNVKFLQTEYKIEPSRAAVCISELILESVIAF